MNLKTHYLKNKIELDPLIIKAFEKKFNNSNIFLAGCGIYLGYPTQSKEYVTLDYSKAKFKNLLKESNVNIKSSMSNKVTIIVWDNHSYYHNNEFNKYNASQNIITWNQFMQPMIDIIFAHYIGLR